MAMERENRPARPAAPRHTRTRTSVLAGVEADRRIKKEQADLSACSFYAITLNQPTIAYIRMTTIAKTADTPIVILDRRRSQVFALD